MKTSKITLIPIIIINLCCYQNLSSQYPGKIAVIGTGYVGLSTGLGLVELGNTVICTDIDSEKIAKLNRGIISIYEPGMAELLKEKLSLQQISFTSDILRAMKEADVIFISVGTPMSDDGAADLSYVESVGSMLSQAINSFKIIVMKSTVPIGTGKWLRGILESKGIAPTSFTLVSNPEFLREGSALSDFLYPDRIIIGLESNNALDTMKSIYQTFESSKTPIVFTDIPTAETIKYASNAFLATKISFINEIACLCDKTGANVKDVARGMGLDKRISPSFLQPGPGFGGSCFPKDCAALLHIAQKNALNLQIVSAALKVNSIQKELPFKKLKNLIPGNDGSEKYNTLKGKTIAILGLAFKANTDDIRYSAAIRTIELLLEAGCKIYAYDPQATENMKKLFPDICYHSSATSALTDADACIILTEWEEFKKLNLDEVAKIMKAKIIVDARAILDKTELDRHGFIYDKIG